MTTNETKNSIFGNVIYQYTRAQAIEDGEGLRLGAVGVDRHRAGGKYAVDVHREKPDARPGCARNAGKRFTLLGRLWFQVG